MSIVAHSLFDCFDTQHYTTVPCVLHTPQCERTQHNYPSTILSVQRRCDLGHAECFHLQELRGINDADEWLIMKWNKGGGRDFSRFIRCENKLRSHLLVPGRGGTVQKTKHPDSCPKMYSSPELRPF